MVAIGLLAFASASFLNLSDYQLLHERYPIRQVTIGIAFVFLLRAVGDFRYVGFFKKAGNDVFSRMDTALYSPLCLIFSINAFYMALWTC